MMLSASPHADTPTTAVAITTTAHLSTLPAAEGRERRGLCGV